MTGAAAGKYISISRNRSECFRVYIKDCQEGYALLENCLDEDRYGVQIWLK